MKAKGLSKSVKTFILALILLVLILPLILTLAYFSDKKEYSGTLDFGSIKLKVSGGVEGDGTDSATSKLVFDTTRKKNNDSTWTGNYMPGDTVEINLTVDLETGSEPAYYVVQISDEKNVFESACYYSDGTKTGDNFNVYVYDGVKTYKQGDTTKQPISDKYCGQVTAGNAQNLTISAKISEDFKTQNAQTVVECRILAIQQANLEPVDAKKEMNLSLGKNLYSVQNRVVATPNGYSSTNNRVLTGNQILVGLSEGNSWATVNVNSNYTITQDKIIVTSTSAGYGIALDYKCLEGQKYIVSANNVGGKVTAGFYDADGKFISSITLSLGSEFTMPTNVVFMTIDFMSRTVGEEATFTDIKIIQN